MDPLVIAGRLIAGVLLILANAFFVAIEFALTRTAVHRRGVRRREPQTRAGVGDDGRPRVVSHHVPGGDYGLEHRRRDRGRTRVGGHFRAGIREHGAASIGSGAILAFLIINLVHLTHGEQTPTYLGVERSRLVCRYGAAPLYWFHWIISPVITLGDGIAKLTLKLFGVEMTGAWLETEEDVIESRADLRTDSAPCSRKGTCPTSAAKR